jgi:hypothetical protein
VYLIFKLILQVTIAEYSIRCVVRSLAYYTLSSFGNFERVLTLLNTTDIFNSSTSIVEYVQLLSSLILNY